jgi:hypothetical protein
MVKQPRYHQENQDHVVLRFSPALSSRSLSSKIPIHGVGPRFIGERRILNAIHQSSIFSEKSQGFCPLPWTAQGDERFSAL